MSVLPSTTYAAPPRLGRGRPLKTISEYEECNFGMRSDSEGDDSDRTIIARPAGLDAKLAATTTKSSLSNHTNTLAPSPIASSPCSVGSSIDEALLGRRSYADSEAGTIFSEDSCPSLADSSDTTFYTDSSRNSVASDQSARSSRRRFPSILIPRGSWAEENSIKEVTLGMSPAQKIMLSPQALQSLPQHVPAFVGPPSLSDRSSLASNSPNVPAISSAPITPDLHNNVPANGASWGAVVDVELPLESTIEIAIDEEHSMLISPSAARSTRNSTGYSTDGYSTEWSDMVVRFPTIPGATPIESTPISPEYAQMRGFRAQTLDDGVRLPNDAMNLLRNLTRSYSPDSPTSGSGSGRSLVRQEMKERAGNNTPPKSAVAETPLSDYSFSQLSIPSPGGFFSSLQASSRATWSMPSQSRASMPSSAAAENFYDLPFKRASQTIQTVLEVPERATTDGPPTARQQDFVVPVKFELPEDDDMYGSHTVRRQDSPKRSPEIRYEYEATYDDELKQAAEVNIDRTSDWLSSQTTYLSALRESNPVNDPSDYIPQTPSLMNDEVDDDIDDSPARKAVRFLEQAVKVNDTTTDGKKHTSDPHLKDAIFLEAFEHYSSQKGRQDAFLQAGARLESVTSGRLAMPVRHVQSLLNTHTTDTLQTHARPRYRGPFSQNPRATGNFHRTAEQDMFAQAERKQLAKDQILPALWMTEAQRKVLFQGRLTACPTAVERLASETKKTRRVLDLAGAATGSWAWSAARKWPHIKVTTVQTNAQAQTSASWPVASKGTTSPIRPENPANHRVITVPELYKLPFRDNTFDVISARTLHMFLRSRPVPEAPSINEWDMTLKECMRILKPNGILDFIMLDSHITNNNSENKSKHSRENSREGAASISPSALRGRGLGSAPPTTSTLGPNATLDPATLNFSRELTNHGFEADGGCSRIASRLHSAGFTGIKRQWVGLPLGRTGSTHDNVTASYDAFDAISPASPPRKAQTAAGGLERSKVGSISAANGRSRTPFPPAPRPISEVSSISRIIEQYANVEAVHGPVGSTADVSDMAGLLGTLMWEEWLVRQRLALRSRAGQSEEGNATYEATSLLHGVNDVLAAGYAKGACFRAVIGWARKPSRKNDGARTPTLARPESEMIEQPVRLPMVIDTVAGRRESSYAARAAKLATTQPGFEGLSSVETPVGMTPVAQKYYGRGSRLVARTPVDQQRGDLTLDTRGVEIGSYGSPKWFTESAVERGDVGTIPMMIVD